MKRLLPRWPIFFLALVPILVLWPAIFGGQAIGPWDHIRSMAPWNGPKPQTPWDVLQADGVLQFAPWRSLVFDSWSNLQIPGWNNYQLMGTPLLANSQSAGFYPLHILMGVLGIPLYPAMTFLAWFHLFWAGLGVYLLVRRMGGTKTGAAIAGASFTMSAFMVYWTALPSVIMTVSWIPWALACTLALFHTDPMWGIAEGAFFSATTMTPQEALAVALKMLRGRFGWTAGLMGSVAMMALAGHLQFLAFGLLAIFFVACFLTIKLVMTGKKRDLIIVKKQMGGYESSERTISRGPLIMLATISPIIRFGFALAFGLCMAAPQLLPVLAFSKQSHRRIPPTAEGYAAYASSAIQPYEWLGLEFPKMIGDPSESMGDPANHSLYWNSFVKRGASFGESAVGIGPLILLLLCCLPKLGWKRGAPIALVGLLGILIACGTPFDRLLYFLIPGWSSTGSPGRAIILFVLAACSLAGLAIQPQEESIHKRKFAGFLIFGFLTIMLYVGAIFGLQSMQSFIPGLVSMSPFISQARTIDAPMFLIAGLITVAAAIAWIWKGGVYKAGMLIAAPLVPFFLVMGVLRFGDPIPPAPGAKTMWRYAYMNKNWDLFVTPQATMPPNLASLLKEHDVAGYDSLLDRDTKALLDDANKQDSSPPENGNMLLIKDSVNPTALANLGVSILFLPDRQTGGPGSRITMTGSEQSVPEIVSEDYMSISIKADGPGLLTLRDRNMPGWTAKVDGKPVSMRRGPFREIDLPVGSHRVEFEYWPPGLTTGLALFLLGILPFIVNVWRWRATQNMSPRI